jgi:hypothetical protein
MASRLFGLARNASEYVRRRMSRATVRADEQIDEQASSEYVRSRRSLVDTLTDFIFGRTDRRYPTQPQAPAPVPDPTQPPSFPGGFATNNGPPPVQSERPRPWETRPQIPQAPAPLIPSPRPLPPLPQPQRPVVGRPDVSDQGGGIGGGGGGNIAAGGEEFDDVQLLGRDAGYDQGDWQVVMTQMRLTPGSSNVYGYYFEFEARTTGILYVTFLATGVGGQRSGPGPTYAYYTVPGRKYHEFARATETSAGNAVWDYLRVRGSMWQHQHNYRLIQPQGDYVPRKATQAGFRTRNVPAIGIGRREYRRSTLPERLFPRNNRGTPDRGAPDRGEPDRG